MFSGSLTLTIPKQSTIKKDMFMFIFVEITPSNETPKKRSKTLGQYHRNDGGRPIKIRLKERTD